MPEKPPAWAVKAAEVLWNERFCVYPSMDYALIRLMAYTIAQAHKEAGWDELWERARWYLKVKGSIDAPQEDNQKAEDELEAALRKVKEASDTS